MANFSTVRYHLLLADEGATAVQESLKSGALVVGCAGGLRTYWFSFVSRHRAFHQARLVRITLGGPASRHHH